ncbi:MAG: hypothetical protein ACKVVP_21165 [Chloroflexota bacterium]
MSVATRAQWCVNRLITLTVVLVSMAGCRDADDLARLAPQVIAPGTVARPGQQAAAANSQSIVNLPPRQSTESFEFEQAGTDAAGQLLFRVRILQDGHPYQVATSKLTPLFSVDGKTSATYVSEAYFRSNPHRSPFTIQPGDEFILPLPPDTFIVRWQEELQEQLGHPAQIREYVSERGDRLRYYLTDPFPIRYELQRIDGEGLASVQLHPDLAFLLGNRRTDTTRLAQLVYRVPDPDVFQMEAVRRLSGTLLPGQATTIQIDRRHQHIDPVREIWPLAYRTEPVVNDGRQHLTRALFRPEVDGRMLAIEDAVNDRTELGSLRDGQVFRIEYERNGTVRVFYKTGPDDARGKRNPYQLRESERWSAIYQRLAPNDDPPVKWGPGTPADLDPFPSARDPDHRVSDPVSAYDFLLPGRTIILTFQPSRTLASARAELEFHDLLRDIRDRYRTQFEQGLDIIERQQLKLTVP